MVMLANSLLGLRLDRSQDFMELMIRRRFTRKCDRFSRVFITLPDA
jgi:hypothetical protein